MSLFLKRSNKVDKDTILHITNSYGGTSVYYNLYDNLDKLGVRQKIFVPLNAKNRNRVGNHHTSIFTG